MDHMDGMSNKETGNGGLKCIPYAPITDKDTVVTVTLPGNRQEERLVFEDYEVQIVDRKAGFLPDPRIVIPKTKEMEVFEDDVFICAFPKCGTHWVWEMCQMIVSGKAEYYSKAKESVMLEFHTPDDYKELERPRIFNTHFTPRCLPTKLTDRKCKIVIIERNPKDVYTSMYHHLMNFNILGDKTITFSTFLEYVLNNDHRETSLNWFYYKKKWLEFRSSCNQPVLILKYEDLKKDTIKCLKILADFLGYPRNESLLTEIKDKCTVNKMKDIEKERDSGTIVSDGEGISNLYRKGIIGDWKHHFTVADNERFDAFLKKNMKEKDLKMLYD